MVVRYTMDLFKHRYYRLCKNLLRLIGQWPYQKTYAKRGCLAVLIFLAINMSVASLLAVAKYSDDSILLKCLFLYIGGIICIVKLMGLIIHTQKTIELINRTGKDWRVWARDREVTILHEYTKQGKKITIFYTGFMYSSALVFMNQPAVLKIIDILLNNGTEAGQFPLPMVYYHINEQKYYFYLITYATVCVCLIMTPLISSDVMLIVYVHHVCGILVALGHKLERIGSNKTSVDSGESSSALNEIEAVYISSCVDRHNDAVEYANLIEASYTRTFFITVGLGMIMINTSGLQILMTINDRVATIGFTLGVVVILIHFYMECCISQILIDHSISIRFYIYNSRWYRLSLKTQKSLQFMAMRCTAPCQLTAGKMMPMSVRAFWLAFKAAISYFGFLRSTQEF